MWFFSTFFFFAGKNYCSFSFRRQHSTTQPLRWFWRPLRHQLSFVDCQVSTTQVEHEWTWWTDSISFWFWFWLSSSFCLRSPPLLTPITSLQPWTSCTPCCLNSRCIPVTSSVRHSRISKPTSFWTQASPFIWTPVRFYMPCRACSQSLHWPCRSTLGIARVTGLSVPITRRKFSWNIWRTCQRTMKKCRPSSWITWKIIFQVLNVRWSSVRWRLPLMTGLILRIGCWSCM